MGLYDTLCAPCPTCGKRHEDQTKAFQSLLRVIEPGDILDDSVPPYLNAEHCVFCGVELVATFKQSRPAVFLGFVTKEFANTMRVLPTEFEPGDWRVLQTLYEDLRDDYREEDPRMLTLNRAIRIARDAVPL